MVLSKISIKARTKMQKQAFGINNISDNNSATPSVIQMLKPFTTTPVQVTNIKQQTKKPSKSSALKIPKSDCLGDTAFKV